jgi:hypothetical protein
LAHIHHKRPLYFCKQKQMVIWSYFFP